MASAELEKKTSIYPSVSVVIPTIGRESLEHSISSVLNQTFKPLEVLVICHESLNSTRVLTEIRKNPSIRILSNSFGTVSENRNQGIRESSGDFVAFLDDDDLWLPNKLEVQLKALSADDIDLLSCRARYQGWKNEIVPKFTYSSSKKFLESLYGNWNFGSRKFGMPTPTIVVKASIAKKYLFETDLSEREDLLFVDRIEWAGCKIVQIEDVLVEVKSSKPFSYRESSIPQDLYWFEHLSNRPSKLNWKFLLTVALRNRLIRFQLLSSLELLFNVFKVRFVK